MKKTHYHWLITGLLLVIAVAVTYFLMHVKPAPLLAPLPVVVNQEGKAAQVQGQVLCVQSYPNGNAYVNVNGTTVKVIGPGPGGDTDEPTKLMLKTTIQNTLGHDVWVRGYRSGDTIVARTFYELSDQPETVPEK